MGLILNQEASYSMTLWILFSPFTNQAKQYLKTEQNHCLSYPSQFTDHTHPLILNDTNK
jgi:hypothetical protein